MSSPDVNPPPEGVRKRRYHLIVNDTTSTLTQRAIHILVVGWGSRVVRAVMIFLIFFSHCLWADLRDYQNFSSPEAMDSAQLGRNIAEGRGYTTDFVRPLSILLVQRWNESRSAGKPALPSADFARLQTGHPDLANPPVYPLFLAGLMKALPFHFTIDLKSHFWSDGGKFTRYEPDFIIVLVNQLFLLVIIGQTYFIARKLFDEEVATVSACLVFGCEMLWDFSLSGLSTPLLLVIFLGLIHLLLAYEATARETTPEKPCRPRLFTLAIAAGLLAGVGELTRYSFGWVMIPVTIFLLMVGGQQRWRPMWCACGAFLVLLGPWVLRNLLISGTPFGTAGFSIAETTAFFPGFQLERSLHLNSTNLMAVKLLGPYVAKLWLNLGDILQNDLPALGRSWVTLLFLAGLLIPFRGVQARRFRYFLLMCLATFAVVQALGRTDLSKLSPVINSENLLILLLPLIFIYGTVFFFTLLNQYKMPVISPLITMRFLATSVFILVMCLPAIGKRFDGKTNPVVFPPYLPSEIQTSAGWLKPREMLMSDVPWAVAWYGHRQCVWLTLNANTDYFAVNDNLKPVKALYISPLTLDERFRSDFVSAPPDTWGNFILNAVTTKQSTLPLTSSAADMGFTSGIFLTDRPRWLEAPPQ